MRWSRLSQAVVWSGVLLLGFGNSHAELFDRGGGLIYESTLNVTFMQDTNYARTSGFDSDGNMNWNTAMSWASSVTYYDSVRNVTLGGWRLPNVAPIDGVALQRDYAPSGTSEVGPNITSPTSELAFLLNVVLPSAPSNPFINLPSVTRWENGIGDWYWNRTQYPFNTSPSAYYFDTINRQQNVSDFTNQHYAWLVRDGDVAPVPEPEGYAMLLAGLGMLGALVRRKTRSSP